MLGFRDSQAIMSLGVCQGGGGERKGKLTALALLPTRGPCRINAVLMGSAGRRRAFCSEGIWESSPGIIVQRGLGDEQRERTSL